MEAESRDHVTRRHDEKERLVWRTSLERDQSGDRLAVHRAAESVHRLGRVSENAVLLHVRYSTTQSRFDFLVRPEWDSTRVGRHSGKILNASARAKSKSVVILNARSLPGTITTGKPSRSQRVASSVAETPASRA